jgi:hypothetical protein
VDQHQRLCPAERGNVVLDPFEVAVHVVVTPALIPRQLRPEALGIQVAQLHRVAGAFQRSPRRVAQRGRQAVLTRMGEDHQDMHAAWLAMAGPAAQRPRKEQTR